ncbi:alkaline phosphatase family protein [Streptomyces sp. NPDC001604]|uniref:alkaline phosphatase family protein n=1 Tax=Streptomyces sp. NPDC001604 TaxID=3364593 RepID=UPI0036B101D5
MTYDVGGARPGRGKVLVVGMDGLRFDRLNRSPSTAPVLHGLMAAGAVGTSLLPYGAADDRAENGPSMAYTDSGPGWSSILTGVWPDRHGVRGNDFVGADYARYPDFLTRATTAGLRTAAAVSWPQLVRRGTLGPAIDRRRRYNGEFRGYRTADRRVARTALRWLTRHDPDVVFVYFGATDEAGHDTGPLSPAYDRALLAQDAHLGRLLQAIDARRSDPRRADERWTVLVTTDHGHLDSGGHGGDTHAEREVFVILAEPGGPDGTRPADGRPCDTQPSGTEPAHPDSARPDDSRPDGARLDSTQPSGTEPAHPDSARSDDSRPDGARLDSTQPLGTEPVDSRPNSPRPDRSRPADRRPDGTRPDDTQPSGTEPAHRRPDGTRPDDTRPADSPPHGSRPHGTQPDDRRPDGTRPGHTQPAHGRSHSPRPPGARLDSPRLIDIAPTVLDRLGIPVDPAWGLQGRVLPRPHAPTSDRS